MKNRILTTRTFKIIVIFIVIEACSHSSPLLEKELGIISYSGPRSFGNYTENPNDKDVYVYKTAGWEKPMYAIEYYRLEADSLACHKAALMTDSVYNRVHYVWKNDCTVVVRLFNSFTHSETKIKVFGYGSNNGVSDETD